MACKTHEAVRMIHGLSSAASCLEPLETETRLAIFESFIKLSGVSRCCSALGAFAPLQVMASLCLYCDRVRRDMVVGGYKALQAILELELYANRPDNPPETFAGYLSETTPLLRSSLESCARSTGVGRWYQ
ncbi:hypothetical protein ARMSODRAFT_951021 [Armillaria solidipes]|uniref:Uncharacterized protein n=1 Tax=Armillaria solidipes TaxID=1076256 RepID=A0A2H3BVV2_9AGAR|nr:hypothetical protein ARMSODRAFT_951021 [Armillaria solidipes]